MEHLGTQLGLKYGELKKIKKTEIGIQMDCMREMLAEWLQGSGGECSKQALKTALQKKLDAFIEFDLTKCECLVCTYPVMLGKLP